MKLLSDSQGHVFLWPKNLARSELGDLLQIAVPPFRIEKQVLKSEKVNGDLMQPKCFFDYFVVGGEWGSVGTNFVNDFDFQMMRDIFEYRKDFRDSHTYKYLYANVYNKFGLKNFLGIQIKNVAQLDENFWYYLHLLEDIEANGYDAARPSPRPGGDDHIGVALNRDKSLFHFRTGHHRLSIAKLLGLAKIPVTIQVLHLDWVGVEFITNPLEFKNQVRKKLILFKESM